MVDARHSWNEKYRVRVVPKTTSYTVTEADSGTVFTTTGASGAVTFTLPAASANTGLIYQFINTVDQDMIIVAGAADTMVTLNDAAADSIAFSTASEKIGGACTVISDGAKWLVFMNLAAEAQTVTVATA